MHPDSAQWDRSPAAALVPDPVAPHNTHRHTSAMGAPDPAGDGGGGDVGLALPL